MKSIGKHLFFDIKNYSVLNKLFYPLSFIVTKYV